MIPLRYLPTAAALLAAVGAGWWLVSTIRERDQMREALDRATAYIEATKDVTNATDDLPDDPDAVLAELCRIAQGGPGCGNP